MKVILISAVLIFSALSRLFPITYQWELKDVIQRVMSKNLVLKQRQIDLDLTKAANDRSWNLLLPDLSGRISMNKIFLPDNPWTASGSVGVLLELNGSLPYQFRELQYLLNKELITYEQARQIHIRDVKDFFYQILLVKEKISLARENLNLIESQYEKTALLYEAGLASDLNLMAIKVDLANIRPEILSLENDYESKMFQLKYLAGLNSNDRLELSGSITLPSGLTSIEGLSEIVSDTLAIQKIKQESLLLDNYRKMTIIQDWIPTLSLEYSYSPGFSQLFTENFLLEDSWSDRTSFMFSISLSLPLNLLLPDSPAKEGLESIDAQILKNRLELDALLYTSNMEFLNLVNSLSGIRQTLDARMMAVEFSKEAYEHTVSSYNNGGVDLLELQNSETDLQESRVAVLTETYNYISTIFDLEYLLGIEIIKE